MIMLTTRQPYSRMLGVLVALLFGLSLQSCQMESNTNVPGGSAEPASDQVRIGGVMWHVDYDVAVDIARKQDKSLWVHFGENPG